MKRLPSITMPLATLAALLMLAALLSACGLNTEDSRVTPTTNPAAALQLTVEPTPMPVPTQPTTSDAPPTPQPPSSGAQFGPITGADYTPEPLHTPLPETVSVRPCRVTIATSEVALHSSPDSGAAAVGTAFEREKLVVDQIATGAAGIQWVHTAAGWLPLTRDGAQVARLDTLRACEILMGRAPNTTLLGLHVLNERSKDQVLSFVQRMAAAGIPVGTVKGLNATETILNEIEVISPQTVTVFRSLNTADGFGDCPQDIFQEPDPVATARRWYSHFDSQWAGVNADYYEYMNECPAPLGWIAEFSIEMMRLANEDGRCLLLFSFPGGNPDMGVFNELLPAYEYAVANECAPGRTHGIALHAYSTEDHLLASESDKWISMRHRILYERLQITLPEAANLPVYITEYGIGGGTILPPCERVIRDALQYTYQIEEDPYVRGFHLWNVGSGAQWYDITGCLPELGDALLAYYGR